MRKDSHLKSMRAGLAVSALFVALATLSSAASATTITIGTSSAGSNAFPFGYNLYVGEYQQLYEGSLFPGPVDITAITFFPDPHNPSYTITGNYALHLSTTSAGVNSLSTTYANNIGPDNALFFSGIVNNVLSFNGGPFLFDPSQGNLLLDVNVVSGNPVFNFLAAGCSGDTNRVYNSGGSGAAHLGAPSCTSPASYGLETQFTFTPAKVPEPSSIALFASGLLGLFGIFIHRRRNSQV